MSLIEDYFLPFTHEGHLWHGYGANYSRDPQAGEYRVSTVRLGLVRSPLVIAVEAARAIARRFSRPTLALSSGVDSQAMLHAFLESGVNFRAAILKFKDGLNDFDTDYIQEICARENIETHIYILDIFDFFLRKKLHLKYHRLATINLPELATHLWLAEKIGNGAVFSGNPPSIARKNGENVLNMPSDSYFCYHRIFRHTGNQGVGHFFLYSSELIHSFANGSVLDSYLKDSRFEFNYATKVETYQRAGFPVVAQDKKFHGFEKVYQVFESRTGRHFHFELFDEIKAIDPLAFREDCDFKSPMYLPTPLQVRRSDL